MNHLANHSAEQASLAGADLTNNDHKLTLFDLQVDVLDVEDVVEGARGHRDVVLSLSGGDDLT